jgi:hypothetical protein
MKQEFRAALVAKGPGGAWTYFSIPFAVDQVFGSKSRVAVAGTINGFPFRNSLMPEGDGTHSMMVSKELQAGANARAGDSVFVSLELNSEERSVTVPEEVEAALKRSPQAASLCRFGPEIETIFHPGRHRHEANAFALADQVWNRPAIVIPPISSAGVSWSETCTSNLVP